MKFAVLAVLAPVIAADADEDNTMLQVGEHRHLSKLGLRHGAKGRIALNTICRVMCELEVDENGAPTTFMKNENREKNTDNCVPKLGVPPAAAAICTENCKVRANWSPELCSRKAGQHDHICDITDRMGDMQLALDAHCTTVCNAGIGQCPEGEEVDAEDKTTRVNCQQSRRSQELCDDDQVCHKFAAGAGFMYFPVAQSAQLVCSPRIITAWKCQLEQCTDLAVAVGSCGTTDDCAAYDDLDVCTLQSCTHDNRNNHDAVMDIRKNSHFMCAWMAGGSQEALTSCYLRMSETYLAGPDADVSSLYQP